MRSYKDMEYTRAAICIRDLNKTIRVVTVDEKGYPGHTGALLIAKYQKQERVEKLLDLGDLLRVEEELEPTTNHPHYIILKSDKERRKLQERVTISYFRDYRENVDGVLKKQKKQVCRVYKTEVEIYYGEGVDYVYIYDIKTKAWDTYSQGIKENKQFMRLPNRDLNYRRLINNLIDREDIEDLLTEEKKYLATYGY